MKVLCLLFFTFCVSTQAIGFKVFTPSKIESRKELFLIVAIHGCKQDGELFADITKLNKLAERKGAVVLYPEQPTWANLDHCWNWFLDYSRELEASQIFEAAQELQQKFQIEARNSLVLGISSGAGIANVVSQCFSQNFGALALHSGLMFGAADSIRDAEKILTRPEGSFKTPLRSAKEAIQCAQKKQDSFQFVPTILIVGTEDKRLNPVHTKQASEQVLNQLDYTDDRKFNNSFSLKKKVERVELKTRYPYTKTSYISAQKSYVEIIVVDQLEHAWSGGAKGYRNSDPKGPSANQLIWKFFIQARE